MADKYRLIPTLDSKKMGNHYYLFDRAAQHTPIVSVPTQKITKAMWQTLQNVKQVCHGSTSHTIDEIKALFTDQSELQRLEMLISSGYFEQVDADVNPDVNNSTLNKTKESLVPFQQLLTNQAANFRTNEYRHYIKKPAFFGLSDNIPDQDVHIGLCGVPVHTLPLSCGTIFGPDSLRQLSQSSGFWFDIFETGMYSEIGCHGHLPKIICKDVVLKDHGDIGKEARTVGDLFTQIADYLNNTVFPNNIRPIFIGGDHAVTFPIVDAFVQQHPSLTLIHLDAHNDLFYTQRVAFNHAGPMHSLLVHSGLKKLHSFGLRTNVDQRVAPFNLLTGDEDNTFVSDRVKMHSIGAFLRLLNDPTALQTYLDTEIGSDSPCYLTIDLDVLSDSAMGGQLSTPAGVGIEFYQLLEFVQLATSSLNIIGADIVEFNISKSTGQVRPNVDLNALLLHLIDGIHKSSLRNQDYDRKTDSKISNEFKCNDLAQAQEHRS